MIGKIPKAGRGFKGIVSYLLNGPRREERQDAIEDERPNDRTGERPNATRNRVLWTDTRNLITADPQKALTIMRATANRSARCKAPVYHFVISWTPDEEPDDDTMRRIVDTTCEDMEMQDLQRIAIAHDDTRHRHVHVVVNRIHPETGKAWNRRQDWVRLEQSLARQAKVLGLRYVPGRHSAPEAFKNKPRKAPDREYQMARRKRLPTPPMKWGPNRFAAERPALARIFDTASSWEDLHASLDDMGLRLEEKAQGHVLRDVDSEIKLSLISKTARIKALELRFGKLFVPNPSPDLRSSTRRKQKTPYVPDPISPSPDLKPIHRGTYSTSPQEIPTNPARHNVSKVDQTQRVREHKPNTDDNTPSDTPSSEKRKRRKNRRSR